MREQIFEQPDSKVRNKENTTKKEVMERTENNKNEVSIISDERFWNLVFDKVSEQVNRLDFKKIDREIITTNVVEDLFIELGEDHRDVISEEDLSAKIKKIINKEIKNLKYGWIIEKFKNQPIEMMNEGELEEALRKITPEQRTGNEEDLKEGASEEGELENLDKDKNLSKRQKDLVQLLSGLNIDNLTFKEISRISQEFLKGDIPHYNPLEEQTYKEVVERMKEKIIEERIEFLKALGFTEKNINRLRKKIFPNLLPIPTIVNSIKNFKELGFEDPVRIFRTEPSSITRHIKTIKGRLDFFREQGFQNPVRMAERVPSLLSYSQETLLYRIGRIKKMDENWLNTIESRPRIMGQEFSPFIKKIGY